MSNTRDRSNGFLLKALHFAFFLTGITTVLIGQVLPILSRRLDLTDSQAGQLFIAQFFGSFLGVFIFNYALKKFGFVKTIVFGLIAVSIACILINFPSIEICFLGFFVNGIGIGATLPSINMLTAELNPTRQTPALNILNFFWGIGAIISQPFTKYLGTETSVLLPTALTSLLVLLSIILIFFAAKNLSTHETTSEPAENDPASKIWNNPIAWAIAFFNFLLVGIESGLGGWLTTYSERFPDGSTQLFAATPVFFLFFVIGRGLAPVISRILTDNRYISISLLVLLAGVVTVLVAESYPILIAGAAVLGIGTSATFPTNMARFTKFFGASATRNSTPIFVLGSIGGASINWLIGFTSTSFDSLRSGIFVLLLCCLLQISIQIYLTKKTTNPSV
ncbi:MAG: MFS transporter [Pyrinomonadaceae bacterium]|nr:MFS transporter [Pyrinomonadaceae bacterium]